MKPSECFPSYLVKHSTPCLIPGFCLLVLVRTAPASFHTSHRPLSMCEIVCFWSRCFIPVGASSLGWSLQCHAHCRFLPISQISETTFQPGSFNPLAKSVLPLAPWPSLSSRFTGLPSQHSLIWMNEEWMHGCLCISSFAFSLPGSWGCVFPVSIFSHSALILQC